MIPVGEMERLARFAALLRERVGLHVRPEGYSALKLALEARWEQMDGAASRPEEYLKLLGSPSGEEELRRLLPLVTVGKTDFFRDSRQFAALGRLLPDLLGRMRAVGRPLAVWSAACATGEEVYSIAMAAAEAGARPGDIELLGTDVNPTAVEAAAAGCYDLRQVRDVGPAQLQRYFVTDADRYRIGAQVRRLVAGVRAHNLASGVYPRPRSGLGWDVIFCRNVLIYFDTPTVREVLARLFEALAPGGYLFLGYSESLFRLHEEFELEEVSGAFLYRRPSAAPVLAAPEPARTGAEARLPPREALAVASRLMEEGRFGAARHLLERSLSLAGEDLAVRLTLANLYAVLRQPDRARACYQAAITLEPLSAEARLFSGVGRFSEGDLDGAVLELSRALLLDPDLVLGHYFLGCCRRAQGDITRARQAWENALDTFRRQPEGKRQLFRGHHGGMPDDGATAARAARYALTALRR